MQDPGDCSKGLHDEWLRIWADTTSDHSVYALTPDGHVRSWNPGGVKIYGYRGDEIVGRHCSVFFTAQDRARHLHDDALLAARGDGRHESEGWRVRKDGSVFWASVVTTALFHANGDFIGFAEIVRDVSDKRRTHDAVIESERRFRLLVEGVTDYSIFMLSPDGYVTNWNHGARRIKGYAAEEIIGSHFSRFYTPEDAAAGLPQRGLETAAREGHFESEGRRVRKDGTIFWAHVIIDAIRDETGTLIGFAKITRDVTEKREADELLKQTQAALFQAQKMEAIGKLTGGVAHDFNNVLQVLRGNLELLQNRHRHDGWSMERLASAIDAVDRGGKLASQLLAFGRRQALRPVVVNLAAMVRGMDDLLRRALGETIEVETVVAGGLWNTCVDTHQLENVLLNLAINARDAMPGGGRLTLELANAMLDDRYVRSLSDVPAGQYVMLGITDTGTGMPPDVMERAFDPFFTTKPEGEGTGLGLSTAYGFVKQSGGHIRIYSEVGHGTTVRIYLPRSTGDALEPVVRRISAVMGGRETVLVVEDDLKVQATVIDMLTELGYTVLKADNAEQALAVLGSGVQVDLLFTDVVMPGALRSPEMARRAVQLLPQMKVLFTSGYTQNAIVHGGRLDDGVELLSKPYSREDLARKVRHVLGTEGEPLPASDPSATPPALRVLVVEDDRTSRESVCELLVMLGHQAAGAANATEAEALLASQTFDVLMTDVNLPGLSGIELARQATVQYPHLFVLFASGDNVALPEPAGFRWRALRKPYASAELAAILRGSR
ncbi:PAS domain S-box protein [Paraburkholderia caballeronis]|uniref:histidine kinase n=1 Tax=Paraburkholderia caballeronis TaxID=416943 RepID=A0A1H7FJ31_9BURK|nr:PAS domain S-box protein [Paraburkholderia caballeronis]PXW25034.1 PAS domain S-box-containing protein [Paraburkholderia caballeronis]PXW93218.1 PAS domain S-box-containing protein [Paraburkholderia caballeronis]RAJ86669.1 PAS domain S-box-containing protein [Paraburkholderia caballeronis]SEE73644.1 PAS domain S-box-containing protein [Paraburkholderia caballeronis]SEK24452.1 PAS domain S-box-containing protein [Paraburkholderia caballeronis]